MKNPKIYTVPYRRKREGKTNYKKRITLLSSGKPRLVARRTSTKFITQIISFEHKGDRVLVGFDSSSLKKSGWKGSVSNIPAAYVTGYILGKKALENNIKEAVFDMGFATPLKGCRLYAVLKGAVDSGLKINCSESIFPPEDRIQGKHIKDFNNNIEDMKK